MNATIQLNYLRALATGCLISFGLAASAGSFTLIDGEGFEAPEYNLAILEGQFGSTFEGLGSGPWVQTPLGGTSTAVVQDSVVASGDQAVRVDRAANSDDGWAIPISGAPAEPIVCIEWDMLVEQSATTGFGPFFGMEAYDDDATSILRVGALGVDAATGEVLITDLPSGFVVTTATVDFDVWNSFRMVLDYSTDTYYSFVNDILVYTTGFESLGADQFTDADMAALAAAGDAASQAATGTAYFDNYLVFETDDFSKIPEPASLAIALLAVGMAASRRR